MVEDIYTQYNIDKKRLQRDYIIKPLIITKSPKSSERIIYEDLIYLYIELNISRKDICKIFNWSIYTFDNWVKYYNVKKDKSLTLKHMYKTNMEKYGNEYSWQNNIIKEKIKETNLKKYGVKYIGQSNIIKEKIKETNLKKYGVEHYTQSNEYNKKCQDVCLQKYGVKYIGQSDIIKEKIKETNLKKYGYKTSLLNDNVKEKIKETNLKKYGVEHYTQSNEYNKNVNSYTHKNYITKKKNNSFNISAVEEQIYQKLKEIFNNVERQYKSEKYPFSCDFYIPLLDLYIEYQGSWTHGNEPFDENNPQHVQIINNWKKKNTKYYNNAIYVWTIKDPEKRNIAIKNQLNWIEFFNYADFETWLK